MSIDVFTHNSVGVRAPIYDGEPWFVAADVARLLEYRMASDMTRRLDDDEKGTRSVRTPGGHQEMTVISESGFYAAILGSQSTKAKAVKRWLTHEVLPSIRETGTYSTTPALTDDELIHQALSISATRVAALTERVAELEPKAELAENYLTASAGSRLVGEAAKILGMKEKQLRAFLLAEKLIFVKHATCGNVLYDHYSDFAPHFEARETVVNHTWGSCNHYTLRITPRGIDLIRKRLRDQEEAA